MIKAGLKQKLKADFLDQEWKRNVEKQERVKQQDGKVVHHHPDKEITVSGFTWPCWNGATMRRINIGMIFWWQYNLLFCAEVSGFIVTLGELLSRFLQLGVTLCQRLSLCKFVVQAETKFSGEPQEHFSNALTWNENKGGTYLFGHLNLAYHHYYQ